MTQQRFFNFGSPISAANINAVHSGFTTKGVLKGGNITVIQPNILSIDPIWLVFPSGIVLHETENVELVVPFSSSTPSKYTITYRHTDGGLVGGNAATIQLESGFILNDNPVLSDGVAIAYIDYPGSGALLQHEHIIQVPRATIDSTVTMGDGDFKFPPFGDGFISGLLSGPAITPSTVDSSPQATYAYRNGSDGIDFTAVASGILGNDISFTFINVVNLNQSLQLDVVNPKTFKITLAKSAGVITSTYNDVVALLMASTAFTSVASASLAVGGNPLATIPAAFPVGTTASTPIYQNLSGGFYNLSYRINNTDLVNDVTHFLRWVFIARKNSPGSFIIDFNKNPLSTIDLTVTDTSGNICTLSIAPDITQSSTITRRIARITNGTFTSGRRFFVQATVLTKASTATDIAVVGASEYSLPF